MTGSPISSLVVDAGVALLLVLPHPYRAHAERFWRRWASSQQRLLAPYLWIAEVTSGVRRAVWEGILAQDEGEEALNRLLRLPIGMAPDDGLARSALAWARRLDQKRAYDAFYVALAEEQGAELWSADRRLVHALQGTKQIRARFIGEI